MCRKQLICRKPPLYRNADTFFVSSTKHMICANVIKMDVCADNQIGQLGFVDSCCHKLSIISCATSRVYQYTFVVPHDNVHEGELSKAVLLHHQESSSWKLLASSVPCRHCKWFVLACYPSRLIPACQHSEKCGSTFENAKIMYRRY